MNNSGNILWVVDDIQKRMPKLKSNTFACTDGCTFGLTIRKSRRYNAIGLYLKLVSDPNNIYKGKLINDKYVKYKMTFSKNKERWSKLIKKQSCCVKEDVDSRLLLCVLTNKVNKVIVNVTIKNK